MRLRLFAALAPLALVGCGGKPYHVASVSGKLTLDGQPLPKASITFVPEATKENIAPGPTAAGMTDAEGRYDLLIDKDTPGAVVGRCRIYISTLLSDPTLDDRDGGLPMRRPKDKVPEKYNQKTVLTFDVPPGGTSQADFDLKSR
jgi:hypothetical protein